MLYPVAIEVGLDGSGYGVVVPDLPGCFSSANTLPEALSSAKEAILFHLDALLEMSRQIPAASQISDYFNKADYVGWLWSLIDVDLTRYSLYEANVCVHLPDSLIHRIDTVVGDGKAYKDCSHFLQVAASNELNRASA